MLGSSFIGRVINSGITLLIEFLTIAKPKIFSKILNVLWVTSVWVNWLCVLLTTELPAQHRGPSVRQVSSWLLWRPKPRPPWWLQALPLPIHWDITTVRSQTNAQTHLQYNKEDQCMRKQSLNKVSLVNKRSFLTTQTELIQIREYCFMHFTCYSLNCCS